MKVKFFFLSIALFVFSVPALSSVSCEAHVKEIQPHNKNGVVWFELTDGTKVVGNTDHPGLDRNLSVALAALVADKKVKILLDDGESCGVNSQDKWSYIVAFRQ